MFFSPCPCVQQQTSLELWGGASRARASFLHSRLSAHGDGKHTWLWVLVPVFRQLFIHCRPVIWWFLVDSWPSWLIFSQQQVLVCVFFHSCAMHFILTKTVVGTVDLGTCNCFELAPSDFPDLLKINNVLCRIDAELVRLSHCSVCGWV